MSEDALRDDLESNLIARAEYADDVADRLNRRVFRCWWGTVIFGALASTLGFIADVPEVKELFTIRPWMISALAAIGGAFEIIRRKTNWRKKSNLFYKHRDDVQELLASLKYEVESPVSRAKLAEISKVYTEKRREFTDAIRLINEAIDESAGESGTTAGHQKRV